MIDFSQVTDLMLGSTPVEQVADSQGNVLWSGGFEVFIYAFHGNVSVNGVIGTFQQTVPSGTVLTVQGIPDGGYMFKNWSDGNTDNPRTITVQDGINLFSDFKVIPNYMYVESLTNSDSTLSITKNNDSAPTIEVFYSTDKQNWSSMGNTSTTAITATVPANGKLYLKATANTWGTSSYYNTINTTGNCNVGGNIMSLLYGDNFVNQTTFPSGSAFNFNHLFYNGRIINANQLLLPATTLVQGCYSMMFSYCTSLTTAPALPATTLANNCYSSMFSNCTSLTTAPELSATTLADYCCQNMFQGCTALTTAPALPATTLANNCYRDMFNGCTSLTTAPALPATTLANNCYRDMFYGCTTLTTAPSILPATTLANNCYMSMFEECTSLTTAPALPATTLAKECYRSMFRYCDNLTKVTTYASNISASSCLNKWLSEVSVTGDFYNLGGATYPSGVSGIPSGWTIHTSL